MLVLRRVSESEAVRLMDDIKKLLQLFIPYKINVLQHFLNVSITKSFDVLVF